MRKTDMISVIVPVYNVEKYLKCCVESIQAQTYKNIEILLIDDGSTDLSGRYCEELTEQDDRIQVIHTENHGLSAARNTGLESAKGEWISFVDSDDRIHPEMLKRLLAIAQENHTEISICGFYYIREDGNIISSYLPGAQMLEGEELHKYFCTEGKGKEYMWNKLFRYPLFQDIRFPEGKIYEDTFVLPELLELSGKASFINWPGYYYLQRDAGISNHCDMNRQFDGLEAKQAKVRFMQQHYPSLVPIAKQEILEACCWLLYKAYIAKGDHFHQNKKRILDIFHEGLRGIKMQGCMIKISIVLITLSPWLFVKLYGLYKKLK